MVALFDVKLLCGEDVWWVVGTRLCTFLCQRAVFFCFDGGVLGSHYLYVLGSDVGASRSALPSFSVVFSVRCLRPAKVLVGMVCQAILSTGSPVGVRLRRGVFEVHVFRRVIVRRLAFRFLGFVHVVVVTGPRTLLITTLACFVMVDAVDFRVLRYFEGVRPKDCSVFRSYYLVINSALVPPFG